MTRARTADRIPPRTPQGATKPSAPAAAPGAARPSPAPRTPKPNAKPGEHVEVLSTAPLDDGSTVYLRPVLEQPSEVVGTAVGETEDEERARREAEEIAPPKYAIVVRGGSFVDSSGTRSTLKAGKEIDDRNYNFGTLQRSGIVLRLITAEQRGQFIPELAVQG